MKKLNLPFIILIKFYKTFLSPLLPRACRFEPSCSRYAQECFEHFVWHRALYLSTHRLMRCHPFCQGGFDPVPQASPVPAFHTEKNT